MTRYTYLNNECPDGTDFHKEIQESKLFKIAEEKSRILNALQIILSAQFVGGLGFILRYLLKFENVLMRRKLEKSILPEFYYGGKKTEHAVKNFNALVEQKPNQKPILYQFYSGYDIMHNVARDINTFLDYVLIAYVRPDGTPLSSPILKRLIIRAMVLDSIIVSGDENIKQLINVIAKKMGCVQSGAYDFSHIPIFGECAFYKNFFPLNPINDFSTSTEGLHEELISCVLLHRDESHGDYVHMFRDTSTFANPPTHLYGEQLYNGSFKTVSRELDDFVRAYLGYVTGVAVSGLTEKGSLPKTEIIATGIAILEKLDNANQPIDYVSIFEDINSIKDLKEKIKCQT